MSSRPSVFPSAEATIVQKAEARSTRPEVKKLTLEGRPVEARMEALADTVLRGARWVRRRPLVMGGAGLALLLVLGSVVSWALVHKLSASAPRPKAEAKAKERAVGVTIRADGAGRLVQAPHYEAAVDGTGRLTSLRVRGVEFLANVPNRPQGAFVAREGGRGALRLAGLEQLAGNLLHGRGDGAALSYEFGADKITCTVANTADERLSFFLFLSRAVVAVGDDRGNFRRTPVGQEEWPTSVWYGGQVRLKVSGGTRVWGAPGEPHQTCYASLSPRETRRLLLEVGAVGAAEAARVANLGGPAAPPPPAAQALSYVCVLSLADRKERVLLSSMDRWDCPVFTPDGRSVLCSSKGRLYLLPVSGGKQRGFPLGDLTASRDYAFSPDGQRLAITVGNGMWLTPAAGGPLSALQPRLSGYIHGWTADSQSLLYAAKRDGTIKIFHRSADGGDEERLLAYDGTCDGLDATRDGKWIYYCGDKSGKMKIWRIPATGAGPNDERAEQVTDDDPGDWFPHPSPDGKWLLFLSHPQAEPGTPDRKEVVLRLMPLPGDKLGPGPIQELARFIGGQGTINSPCWSPDGKSIAYVRYAPR
jgi:hypothetical protein